jgi:hypothetical protein
MSALPYVKDFSQLMLPVWPPDPVMDITIGGGVKNAGK